MNNNRNNFKKKYFNIYLNMAANIVNYNTLLYP